MAWYQILQLLPRGVLLSGSLRLGEFFFQGYGCITCKHSTFICKYSTNTAPSLGPVLGGLIAAYKGWRWFFWFLSITSGFCLVAMVFLLPETARKIVGNGSSPVSRLYKLPFSNITGYRTCSIKTIPRTSRECHVPNPWFCISTLFYKDVAIIVGTVGILYMTCVCVQASLSSIYINLYGFGELQSGLIYLPYGFGCALAAFLTGEKLRKVSFSNQLIVLTLI